MFQEHQEPSCISEYLADGNSQARVSSQTKINDHPKHTPLVLLADDDDDNLLVISYAMELSDVNFMTAQTGYEVLSLAKQHCFSLLFLDIKFPDIDGISICKRLRQDPKNKLVPIIAVTALARKCDRDAILRNGFTDYLLKPYLLDDLSAITDKYLLHTNNS